MRLHKEKIRQVLMKAIQEKADESNIPRIVWGLGDDIDGNQIILDCWRSIPSKKVKGNLYKTRSNLVVGTKKNLKKLYGDRGINLVIISLAEDSKQYKKFMKRKQMKEEQKRKELLESNKIEQEQRKKFCTGISNDLMSLNVPDYEKYGLPFGIPVNQFGIDYDSPIGEMETAPDPEFVKTFERDIDDEDHSGIETGGANLPEMEIPVMTDPIPSMPSSIDQPTPQAIQAQTKPATAAQPNSPPNATDLSQMTKKQLQKEKKRQLVPNRLRR